MTCNLTEKKLMTIKEIEQKAFPAHMRQYDDIESMEDVDELTEDCTGDFFCHIETDWYILGCNSDKVYVEDFASTRSLGLPELYRVIKLLRSFGDKIIEADFRQSTSYRLIKMAEKKKIVEIIDESPWNWDGEKMTEVTFKILPPIGGFLEWFYSSENFNESKKYDFSDVRRMAKKGGLDIFPFERQELIAGINTEIEHKKSGKDIDVIGNHEEKMLKIAMAHLREDPHYYKKLKKAGL